MARAALSNMQEQYERIRQDMSADAEQKLALRERRLQNAELRANHAVTRLQVRRRARRPSLARRAEPAAFSCKAAAATWPTAAPSPGHRPVTRLSGPRLALQAELAARERQHERELEELKASHQAELFAHAAATARLREELGAEVESLGQAHFRQAAAHAAQARGLIHTSGFAETDSRAVVVRNEADASQDRAQHEACEASLRTMLAIESSRLRNVRAEVRAPPGPKRRLRSARR
jgi:stage V sporulation protein SpoVS